MAENSPNQLYYGDNLDVLRLHVPDESVDLVYLDPPFNSNADYNVLFAERDGTQAAAQIKAFEDTWRWDQGSELAYQEVVESGGNVSRVMQAFRTFLGLLKQVWVGNGRSSRPPQPKAPAFAASTAPRDRARPSPPVDCSSRIRREAVDGRDAPVQPGPQGP